ncbi:response regulator [Actinomycetota bacterium]
MITVVIADDHPLVRDGLRAVFAGASDIDIVGEADNGRDAVSEVVRHEPDVVVMDLDMPELHGIEATREINAQCPTAAVLVLTMFEDDESVFAAVSAGATGYLLKGSDGTDILAAVRAAASGQTIFGTAFADRLRNWLAGPAPAEQSPFPELTPRELDILDRLAAGLTNPEIGERLHLSTKTIANNVSTILNKLHFTQRGQAIVRAREAGLGRDDSAGPANPL